MTQIKGLTQLEKLEKFIESKHKFDKDMEAETRKGSFSERVRFLVERDRWDNVTPDDWIETILKVADERKL